jgi:hypothetical protein
VPQSTPRYPDLIIQTVSLDRTDVDLHKQRSTRGTSPAFAGGRESEHSQPLLKDTEESPRSQIHAVSIRRLSQNTHYLRSSERDSKENHHDVRI